MQTGQFSFPYSEMANSLKTVKGLKAYLLRVAKARARDHKLAEEYQILDGVRPLYLSCSVEKAKSLIQRMLKTEKDKDVLASLEILLTDLPMSQGSSRSTETHK
jgi:hypothetical protein